MHLPSISVFWLFWLAFASLQHNQLTSRQRHTAAIAVPSHHQHLTDGGTFTLDWKPWAMKETTMFPPQPPAGMNSHIAPMKKKEVLLSRKKRKTFKDDHDHDDDDAAGVGLDVGMLRRQSASINSHRMSHSEWSEQQQQKQQQQIESNGRQVVGELPPTENEEEHFKTPTMTLNKLMDDEKDTVILQAVDNSTEGTTTSAMTTTSATTTTTSSTTSATTTTTMKNRLLKKAKESSAHLAGPPDEKKYRPSFLEQFKESVTKLLGTDQLASTATIATSTTPSQSSSSTHGPERRHIVPEKLQYTREITLKQGRVMGIVRHFQASTGLQNVDQFLGLPYAESPVGSRRFMPPGAALPWQDLKIARHLPPVCPQRLPESMVGSAAGGGGGVGNGEPQPTRGRYKYLMRLLPYLKAESEDCLHLNVYVPHRDPLEYVKPFSVLVYIHGESFEWNSGNPYDGSVLASYGQVIVVTINYRLGVLGFLKPGLTENTIANFGLLDQIAALHWIKENIGSFGGDPESVTLMGHGTGAACVNYLMVSPVASGLFHRAILMSGSAMSDWAASNHSLQLTMQIAHTLDCPLLDADEDEQLLDCLRDKRYEDLLRVPAGLSQFSTPLGPIVDGLVIPYQPYKSMGTFTDLFSRYDLLFGVTESESYHALGALALEQGLRESERDNLLRFYMQNRFDVRPDLALAATLKKYNEMYNNPIKATTLEHRDVVLDILSDARVVGPLIQTGLFHADVNRHNYMYVFGHNSAAGPHANVPHSIHGEELAFVFGAPLAPAGPFASGNYSVQEKLLAEAVMAYWTNFAKSGNPKAPWRGSFINLHALEWDRYDMDWPEFSKRTQAYCNIGIPPSIGYKYRQLYMHFWNKELPDELNQIAALQQQPFLPVRHYAGNEADSDEDGGNGDGDSDEEGRGNVVTGQMSKFGSRDSAEDPVRTLQLLLREPYAGGGVGVGQRLDATAADNMYNAPTTFGVARRLPPPNEENEGFAIMNTSPTNAFSRIPQNGGNIIYGSTRIGESGIVENNNSDGGGGGGNTIQTEKTEQSNSNSDNLIKSETTLKFLIAVILVVIVLNVLIYSSFLVHRKNRKQTALSKRAKLGGGILSYDGATDDELKRTKHHHTGLQSDVGDDSYVLDVVRKSNTYEAVKMDRSPINGFRITRQLSASTVDTHTKVSEWICAAAGGGGGGGDVTSGGFNSTTHNRLPSSPKISQKSSTSSSTAATFSSLHGGGSGGGGGNGSGGGGSGTFSPLPHKVSVAVDATPQARGNSVLAQEPIELTKLKANDGRNIIICQDIEVTDQEMLTPQSSLDAGDSNVHECQRFSSLLGRQFSTATTAACDAELPQQNDPYSTTYNVDHQHSRSDPVDMMFYRPGEQITSFMDTLNGRGEDINVTSRDELTDSSFMQALTPEQQLLMMKQRNYPKVLPTATLRRPPAGGTKTNERETDSPPMTLDLMTTNKRYSLPPNGLQPWNVATYGGGKYVPPPMPPPRISTLGRRHHSPGDNMRRGSNSFTTSPVTLARDCTEEEDEEPQITQNTLIVGPIVPKAAGSNSATPKRARRKLENGVDESANDATNTDGDGAGDDDQRSPKDLTTISSSLPSHHHHHHHTEKVYTIGVANTGNSSGDVAKGPVMDSLPTKIAIKPNLTAATAAALNRLFAPSLIPRIVSATTAAAAAAAVAKPTATLGASAALSAAVALTAAPLNCNRINSLQQQQQQQQSKKEETPAISRIPQLSKSQSKIEAAPMTEAINNAAGMTTAVLNKTAHGTNATATVVATPQPLVPQTATSLSDSIQNGNTPTTTTTTTKTSSILGSTQSQPSAAATATSPSGTNPSSSTQSERSSTRSSTSSSSSTTAICDDSSSTTSSSSSSTGTVRTELQQK